MLEKFITNLSHRFRSENDLSDITWTLCHTSEKFKKAFLKFFFPWLGDDCCDVWINREYPQENSRADFAFEYQGQTYVIENKIYDKVPHFEQYVKDYKIPATRLGYIANYPIAQEGFETKTWTELYFYLSERIPMDEKKLWKAYLAYMKEICGIFKTNKPMNLQGMFSLFTFYKCLDNVFAFDTDAFNSRVYDSRVNTNQGGNIQGTPREGIMGKYFILKLKKCYVKEAMGWMGVYFNLENPIICISFCNYEGWGWPINKIIAANHDVFRDGEFASTPYQEDGAYWFEFRKDKEFNRLSLEDQIQMLRDFFEEVIMSIYNIKTQNC